MAANLYKLSPKKNKNKNKILVFKISHLKNEKKLETSLGGHDYNTDLTYFRWGKRCTNPYL